MAEYGVSAHKRFFLMDLWNGNSRPRVIESLAELARVAAVKKFAVSMKPSSLPAEQIPFPLSADQVKVLTEQLSKTRTRETGAQRKDAPGIFKRKLALLTGEKGFPEFERRWTRIQALMRARAARAKFQSRLFNQAVRDKVAFELRDTEASYLASLKVCIDKYLTPLKTGSWNKKLILPAATLKTMFSDIEIIYNVNNMLKQSIDKCMQTWQPASKLGSIFVAIMGFLKVYSNYVSRTDAQLQEYDNLLKGNKLFAQFVDEVRNSSGDPASPYLDIPGYLIMPVQRVPRYFMLLERLLKNTWKDHQDYADLEKSVDGLQAVAIYLNDKKRAFENIRGVLQFQSNVLGCPQIAMPTRSLVQQYDLQDIKKKDDYLIVLFNDALLVAKSEKKKTSVTHKFKEFIAITEGDITAIEGGEKGYDIQKGGTSILKLAPSPESSQLSSQFYSTKAHYHSGVSVETHEHAEEMPNLEITIESAPITAEELLRQREQEKKHLKTKMQEELKQLDTPVDPASTRSASPSRIRVNHPTIRSTQSLLKMKAIVEQEITLIDAHLKEDQSKSEEYKQMAAKLNSELDELDQKLEDVKTNLSPEVKEALNQEESAVRLQVEQEPTKMKSKKKARRSWFASIFSKDRDSSPSKERPSSPSTSPSKDTSSPTKDGSSNDTHAPESPPQSLTIPERSKDTNDAPTSSPQGSAKLAPPSSGKARSVSKPETPTKSAVDASPAKKGFVVTAASKTSPAPSPSASPAPDSQAN